MRTACCAVVPNMMRASSETVVRHGHGATLSESAGLSPLAVAVTWQLWTASGPAFMVTPIPLPAHDGFVRTDQTGAGGTIAGRPSLPVAGKAV